MYWYADDQDAIPEMNHSCTRSLAFISNTAKSEFYTRIIKDMDNNKTGLREVLESGILQDIANFLLSTILSSIPLIGDTLSVVWDVGTMTYNYMDSLDALVYEQRFAEIENTNQYIVGQHYYFYTLDPLATGNYKIYSVSSGTYYGATYQRGKFVEVFLKHS